MRDFKSGNIGGDVYIEDNSFEYKPLGQLSDDELIKEEKNRNSLLENERVDKHKNFLRTMAFAVILIIIAASWFFYKGDMNSMTFLLGAAGVIVALVSIRNMDEPSEFEVRQVQALNEIHMLLRERGVR